MKNNQKNPINILKFIFGWVISFAFRLFPYRPPNFEPILAVQMPFTKKFGFIAGFIFAFFNIVLFDLVMNKVGLWTIITASAYGLLAIYSHWYFKKRKNKGYHYAIFAIYATLFYDAVTGLSIGPLFFGQSFQTALIGQIPFTIYHLLGNVSLGFIFSPAIYRFVVANPKINFNYLKHQLANNLK